MLESLMKPTSKSPNSNYSSPKRQSTIQTKPNQIPQLIELQKQIQKNKPNNIIQFIRDWANNKLNRYNKLSKNNIISDDQDINYSNIKIPSKIRRMALCVTDHLINTNPIHKIKTSKLQQTKSMILIKLRKLDFFKNINDDQIWQLIEEFKEKQYQPDQIIINRNQFIKSIHIIVSGSVSKKIPNLKPTLLIQGNQFGNQSIVFQNKSIADFISIGNTKIASLQGRTISQYIRKINEQKYKIICRSFLSKSMFKSLHKDQLDRLADIGMNQIPIFTYEGQEFDVDSYPTSFFIILQGQFSLYMRRIMNVLIKEPTKTCRPGEVFSTECLFDEKVDFDVVSQKKGILLEIKCNDVEKILGPLSKLLRRRRGF